MVLASRPKPRQTVEDKKRHGKHHKTTHHYIKTYWPYLPMFLVLIVGVIINFTWDAGKAVLGYATNISPQSLLQETNIQRAQHGRSALVLNNKLAAAAQAKANDMAARNYWSHTTPDGVEPWQFIVDAGYSYRAAGENLAYGFDSSSATVAGWMNSPGHRTNILNSDYQEVGFGIANAANYQGRGPQTIVVALYAQPQTIVSPETASSGVAAISAHVPDHKPQVQATKQDTIIPSQHLEAQSVSRIAVLTSGAGQWTGVAVAVIAAASIFIFCLRHVRLWHRLLVKSEEFIIRHPVLDTLFVAIGVLGFLLTRTTGFIH